MHDELTAQDIEQMRAELKERKTTALPELIKAVQEDVYKRQHRDPCPGQWHPGS